MKAPNLSTRIERLRKHAYVNYSDSKSHKLCIEKEVKAYAMITYDAYRQSSERLPVLRKASFLSQFAKNFPVDIGHDELIVGSQAFLPCDMKKHFTPEQLEGVSWLGNSGHIIVDYGRVLKRGINGLLADIESTASKNTQQAHNRQAMFDSIKAFGMFIRRYAQRARALENTPQSSDRKNELAKIAEVCEWISENSPRNFHEALQLTFFVHIFLHAEGRAVAFSYGRFDQFLWPYLKNDLERGDLTMDAAYELLACFWLKNCYGDESQNLLVGGTTAAGKNAENLLSIMCLNVVSNLCVCQPTLSVRVHSESSDDFWDAILELLAKGIGLPSLFNDKVSKQALMNIGVPEERANDWGIVGCFEPTTQGDMQGCTVHSTMSLPALFIEFFHADTKYSSFQDFYEDWLCAVEARYQEVLVRSQESWDERTQCASPFESACLTGCIESGLTVEEKGARFTLWGTNIAGIGTLVDCLYVVKKLVFEQRRISLDDLRMNVANDFKDESICQLCRHLEGKFGSDSEETNRIAEDFSRFLTRMVLESRLENGIRTSPGFFWFGYDINPNLDATPDGRRRGDRISYGTGPGIYCDESETTSILRSTTHVDMAHAPNGAPLIISFSKRDVKEKEGLTKIRQLIEAYFKQGGACVQCNIIDAEKLRDAKQNPEAHPDLSIKISGYSARFTKIGEHWQDALIERTENGL